jgi:hypothetical protein
MKEWSHSVTEEGQAKHTKIGKHQDECASSLQDKFLLKNVPYNCGIFFYQEAKRASS